MTDTSDEYPIFLGSEIEQPAFDDALFHVIPVPMERTVSYGGGTSRGPSSILQASWQLETWDNFSDPSTMGIYTHQAVDCDAAGDTVIDNIASAVRTVAAVGKLPVAIGGEHTVTFGVIKGLMDAGIKDFGIVQVDAHADLRDAYEGDPLSHASVMKRCVESGTPLLQLGIRAFCEEEMLARQQHGVKYHDADELVPANITDIVLPADFPANVFFTLDIDGMDPSVFPSTGTPVPGGLGWYQTLSLFQSVCRQRRLVGFDVMEFAPIDGFHAYDFAAALLIYKMMGIVQREQY